MTERKIMIDFRHISAQTGFSTYLIMILKAINSVDREFYLLLNDNSFKFDEYLTNNKNIKFVYAKSKPFSMMQNVEIPLILKKYDIDLYHNINYDIPLFMLLCPQCKLIATIHDLIPLVYKKLKKRSLIKNIYFEIMHRLCVLLSDKILTVSDYSKNDIINHLKVSKDKVTTIYCSYNGKELPKKDNITMNTPVQLFFIGTNFEHKNIHVLVETVKILKEKGIDTILNIAGKETSYTELLRKMAEKYKITENVKIWGKVSEETASELYKNSDIFCFPSLVEGFGIPPLEAMSYGIPVISSNKTVMPEVIGDAGILIDPTPENFAEKIEYLINNPDYVRKLISKGYERIRDFSQEKFNMSLLKSYEVSNADIK